VSRRIESGSIVGIADARAAVSDTVARSQTIPSARRAFDGPAAPGSVAIVNSGT